MRKLLACTIVCGLAVAGVACKKDDDKAKVGAKVRSTGSSLGLHALQLLKEKRPTAFPVADQTFRANVMVNLDYYKVPISRINLVTELSGTAYNQASSDIYTCTGANNEECLVDIAEKTNVDNLLKVAGKEEYEDDEASGADQVEVEEQTYDGVAVEFCHNSTSYEIYLKGTVELDGVTYYTDAKNGLKTKSPAEEVVLDATNTGCGVTTKLIQPVKTTKDSSINIVLYTDPVGSVYATDDIDFHSANGCLGKDNTGICAEPVAIFGTVDDSAPKVERYSLSFADGYNDIMATILFNSDDVPFGAQLRNLYTDEVTARAANSSASVMAIATHSDGSFDLKRYDGEDFIAKFKRKAHTGTIKNITDAPMEYEATPLD
jgi:hypothetical protein